MDLWMTMVNATVHNPDAEALSTELEAFSVKRADSVLATFQQAHPELFVTKANANDLQATQESKLEKSGSFEVIPAESVGQYFLTFWSRLI